MVTLYGHRNGSFSSRYKKINKIKLFEIIIKKIHLSKAIITNLPRMKKSIQNRG
jgi:hypothetical protein